MTMAGHGDARLQPPLKLLCSALHTRMAAALRRSTMPMRTGQARTRVQAPQPQHCRCSERHACKANLRTRQSARNAMRAKPNCAPGSFAAAAHQAMRARLSCANGSHAAAARNALRAEPHPARGSLVAAAQDAMRAKPNCTRNSYACVQSRTVHAAVALPLLATPCVQPNCARGSHAAAARNAMRAKAPP